MKNFRKLVLIIGVLILLVVPMLYSCTDDTVTPGVCPSGGEHNFGSWRTDTPATCTEAGSRSRECRKCGEKENDVIAAYGHVFYDSDYVTDNNATCKEDGTKTAECGNRCGVATDTVKDVGSALGHNFETYIPSEDGFWETSTCSRCKEVTNTLEVGLKEEFENSDSFPARITLAAFVQDGYEDGCEIVADGDNSYLMIRRNNSLVVGSSAFGVEMRPNYARYLKGKTYVVEFKVLITQDSGDLTLLQGVKKTASETFLTYDSATKRIMTGDIIVYDYNENIYGDDISAKSLGDWLSLAVVLDDLNENYDVYVEGYLVQSKINYSSGKYYPGVDLETLNINMINKAQSASEFGLDDIYIYVGDEVRGVKGNLTLFERVSVGGDLSIVVRIPDADCTHVWVVSETNTANCGFDGYQVEKCSVCDGERYKDGSYVAKSGQHTLVFVDEGEWVKNTCTDDGYKGQICSVCGYKTATILNATGHDFELSKDESKDATCTETGIEVSYCKNCQLKRTDILGELGHDLDPEYTDIVRDSTCAAKGLKQAYCKRCWDLVDQEIPLKDHTWGVPVVTTPATCTEKGVKTLTCTVCNTMKTEEINATGHEWDDGVVTEQPTCTEYGVKTYTCKNNCGTTEVRRSGALGHTSTEFDEVVAPSCHEDGYEIRTCDVCEETYKANYVVAKGHNLQYSQTTLVRNEENVRVFVAECQNKNCDFKKEISGTMPMPGEYITEISDSKISLISFEDFVINSLGDANADSVYTKSNYSYIGYSNILAPNATVWTFHNEEISENETNRFLRMTRDNQLKDVYITLSGTGKAGAANADTIFEMRVRKAEDETFVPFDVSIYSEAEEQLKYYTLLSFDENGNIRSSGTQIGSVGDEWSRIAVAMHPRAGSFDVFIDGVVVAQNVPFAADQYDIDYQNGIIGVTIASIPGTKIEGAFDIDDLMLYSATIPVYAYDINLVKSYVYNYTFDSVDGVKPNYLAYTQHDGKEFVKANGFGGGARDGGRFLLTTEAERTYFNIVVNQELYPGRITGYSLTDGTDHTYVDSPSVKDYGNSAIVMEFDFMVSSRNLASSIGIIQGVKDVGSAKFQNFISYSSGYITHSAVSPAVNLYEIGKDEWVTIYFCMNNVENTYSLYINGELYLDKVAIPAGFLGTSTGRFLFRMLQTSGSGVYDYGFDNFKLYEADLPYQISNITDKAIYFSNITSISNFTADFDTGTFSDSYFKAYDGSFGTKTVEGESYLALTRNASDKYKTAQSYYPLVKLDEYGREVNGSQDGRWAVKYGDYASGQVNNLIMRDFAGIGVGPNGNYDFSGYDTLRLELYLPEETNYKYNIQFYGPNAPDGISYYHIQKTISGSGWVTLDIPFSSMQRNRNCEWSNITYFTISVVGWDLPTTTDGTTIYIADIAVASTGLSDTYTRSAYPCKTHVFTLIDSGEASCSALGYEIRLCEYCGYKKVDMFPKEECKLVGEPVVQERVEATCTGNGYVITTYECEDCGEYTIKRIVFSQGHDWVLNEDDSVASTCAVNGYDVYECSGCELVGREALPKADHTPADGYTTDDTHHWIKCSVCGDVVGSKVAHIWDAGEVKVEGDCKENILREVLHTCTVCDHTTTVKSDPEHTRDGVWVSDENNHWQTCLVCEEKLSQEKHTSTGWIYNQSDDKHYKYCTVCDRVLNDTGENTGHDYVFVTSHRYVHWEACSYCGIEKPGTVKTKHIFSSDTHADSDGTTHSNQCSGCGAAVNKSPHIFEWEFEEIEGVKKFVVSCKGCDYRDVRDGDSKPTDYEYSNSFVEGELFSMINFENFTDNSLGTETTQTMYDPSNKPYMGYHNIFVVRNNIWTFQDEDNGNRYMTLNYKNQPFSGATATNTYIDVKTTGQAHSTKNANMVFELSIKRTPDQDFVPFGFEICNRTQSGRQAVSIMRFDSNGDIRPERLGVIGNVGEDWLKISVSFNFAENYYDVYFDGVLVAEKVRTRPDTNDYFQHGIVEVRINFSGTTFGSVDLDDIYFYYGDAPKFTTGEVNIIEAYKVDYTFEGDPELYGSFPATVPEYSSFLKMTKNGFNHTSKIYGRFQIVDIEGNKVLNVRMSEDGMPQDGNVAGYTNVDGIKRDSHINFTNIGNIRAAIVFEMKLMLGADHDPNNKINLITGRKDPDTGGSTLWWNNIVEISDGYIKAGGYSLKEAKTGEWTQITFSVDHLNKAYSIYIDGYVYIDSAPMPSGYANGTKSPVYRFFQGQDSAGTYDLYVDDLRVYERYAPYNVLGEGHVYSDWEYDETNHWKVCSICGEKQLDSEEAHDWDEGVITTPATCTDTGVKTITCTACGATTTEEVAIDPDAHSYTEWGYDDENHWNICEYCDEVDSTSTAAHAYPETWLYDAENEVHYRMCTSGCGHRMDGVQNHSYAPYGDYDWQYSEAKGHYKACTLCGTEDSSIGEDHVWAGGRYEDGLHYSTCELCGFELAGEPDHTYGAWIYDEDTNKHYRECSLCDYVEHSAEEGHIYAPSGEYEWTYSEEKGHYKNCTLCGFETTGAEAHDTELTVLGSEAHGFVCKLCGDTQFESHDFDVEIILVGDTYMQSVECKDCGYSDVRDYNMPSSSDYYNSITEGETRSLINFENFPDGYEMGDITKDSQYKNAPSAGIVVECPYILKNDIIQPKFTVWTIKTETNGNKYLEFTHQTADQDAYIDPLNSLTTPGADIVFEFSIRKTSGVDFAPINVSIYNRVTNGVPGASGNMNGYTVLNLKADSSIVVSRTNVAVGEVGDEWQKIAIVVRPEANAYDIYLDGILVAENVLFSENAHHTGGFLGARVSYVGGVTGVIGSSDLDDLFLYYGSTPKYVGGYNVNQDASMIINYNFDGDPSLYGTYPATDPAYSSFLAMTKDGFNHVRKLYGRMQIVDLDGNKALNVKASLKGVPADGKIEGYRSTTDDKKDSYLDSRNIRYYSQFVIELDFALGAEHNSGDVNLITLRKDISGGAAWFNSIVKISNGTIMGVSGYQSVDGKAGTYTYSNLKEPQIGEFTKIAVAVSQISNTYAIYIDGYKYIEAPLPSTNLVGENIAAPATGSYIVRLFQNQNADNQGKIYDVYADNLKLYAAYEPFNVLGTKYPLELESETTSLKIVSFESDFDTAYLSNDYVTNNFNNAWKTRSIAGGSYLELYKHTNASLPSAQYKYPLVKIDDSGNMGDAADETGVYAVEFGNYKLKSNTVITFNDFPNVPRNPIGNYDFRGYDTLKIRIYVPEREIPEGFTAEDNQFRYVINVNCPNVPTETTSTGISYFKYEYYLKWGTPAGWHDIEIPFSGTGAFGSSRSAVLYNVTSITMNTTWDHNNPENSKFFEDDETYGITTMYISEISLLKKNATSATTYIEKENVAEPCTGEHTYVKTTVAPSCFARGYDLYVCEVCGDAYAENYTPRDVCSDREIVKQNIVSAICTANGSKTTTYSCAACGTYTLSEILYTNGHNWTFVETVEAESCDEMEYDLYHCDGCDTYARYNIVYPTGHNLQYNSEKVEEQFVYVISCLDCDLQEVRDVGEMPDSDEYLSMINANEIFSILNFENFTLGPIGDVTKDMFYNTANYPTLGLGYGNVFSVRKTVWSIVAEGEGEQVDNYLKFTHMNQAHTYIDLEGVRHGKPGADMVLEISIRKTAEENFAPFTIEAYNRAGGNGGDRKGANLVELDANGGIKIPTTGYIIGFVGDDWLKVAIAIHPSSNAYDVYFDGILVTQGATLTTNSTTEEELKRGLLGVRIQYDANGTVTGSRDVDDLFLYYSSSPKYVCGYDVNAESSRIYKLNYTFDNNIDGVKPSYLAYTQDGENEFVKLNSFGNTLRDYARVLLKDSDGRGGAINFVQDSSKYSQRLLGYSNTDAGTHNYFETPQVQSYAYNNVFVLEFDFMNAIDHSLSDSYDAMTLIEGFKYPSPDSANTRPVKVFVRYQYDSFSGKAYIIDAPTNAKLYELQKDEWVRISLLIDEVEDTYSIFINGYTYVKDYSLDNTPNYNRKYPFSQDFPSAGYSFRVLQASQAGKKFDFYFDNLIIYQKRKTYDFFKGEKGPLSQVQVYENALITIDENLDTGIFGGYERSYTGLVAATVSGKSYLSLTPRLNETFPTPQSYYPLVKIDADGKMGEEADEATADWAVEFGEYVTRDTKAFRIDPMQGIPLGPNGNYDLTGYDTLIMKIYVPAGTEYTYNVLFYHPYTTGNSYFHKKQTITSTDGGWQTLVIPFTDFGNGTYSPKWNNITHFTFQSEGWQVNWEDGTTIYIADVIIAKTTLISAEPVCDEHDFEQTTFVDSTLSMAGYMVETCNVCRYEKVTTIDRKTADTITVESETLATCTTNGQKITVHAMDGETTVKFKEIISRTDHDWVSVKYVDATCTEAAYQEYKCSKCNVEGRLYSDNEPALGHNPSEEWSEDATEHWHVCLRCDEKLDFATHTYVDAYSDDQHWEVCSVCGYETEKSAHVWGVGEVTLAPTCTTEGVKTFTCECGKTKTEAVAVDPEAHTLSVENNPSATCIASGTKTTSCSECDYSKVDTIAPTGVHVYDEVTGICSLCNVTGEATNSAEFIALLNNNGIVTIYLTQGEFELTEDINVTRDLSIIGAGEELTTISGYSFIVGENVTTSDIGIITP